MKRRNSFLFLIIVIIGLALAISVAAYAQSMLKPYEEGFAASRFGRSSGQLDQVKKSYAEGEGYSAAGALIDDSEPKLEVPEGEAGKSGVGSLESLDHVTDDGLNLLYLFSGVTDDGQQGSGSRREATSIHCTNVWTDTVQVEVDVYQWNGMDVFTGTVGMPVNRTFTFSTQNTTIYFDDVLLGGVPGTTAIFQGHGRIYTDNPNVVCTAQALDPLNYPPVFATSIDLFKP